MASILTYVHPRDTPAVDGLCPGCFNPALKLYILEKISIEGIDLIGERIMCVDCRKWRSPLKKYKETATSA